MEKQDITTLKYSNKTVIGTSVCLVPLSAAHVFFPGYTRRGLLKLFRALSIPIFHDKSGDRFNLYTLEEILHYLLRPDGAGFAAPSSSFKNHTLYKHPELGCTKTQITPADLQEITSPSVRRARKATGLNAFAPHRRKYPDTPAPAAGAASTPQEQGLGVSG
jgi:hypothetical protein